LEKRSGVGIGELQNHDCQNAGRLVTGFCLIFICAVIKQCARLGKVHGQMSHLGKGSLFCQFT
jgi:hypothetical protein